MIVRFLTIIAVIAVFTFKSIFGVSQDPWRNKTLTLESNTPCQSYLFDGGPKEFSPMFLSLFAEKPIWVVIYDGDRFIRENIHARRRLVFNFITQTNFTIEICRNNFLAIKKLQAQQMELRSGKKIDPAEILPEIDPTETEKIKILLSTN
ncbi:MAG: hypothetical protein JJV97_02870 [SAR324 cluster bacterium]|nr:hypothetical protein [SAR324 cluster bacterium]